MSSKVVFLEEWRIKKLVKALESGEPIVAPPIPSERIDADQFFADIQRRNEENKRREEKERSKNNAGTIRSYKLKEE